MKGELLSILNYFEREKGLDRETIIKSIEEGLFSVYRKRVDIEGGSLHLDVETGEVYLIKDGERERLPSLSNERIAAQSAKQIILQKLREAEKWAIFEEYEKKKGEIVSGTVDRFERGDIFVQLGKDEALLSEDEIPKRERHYRGQIVRALLLNVKREGEQLFLSRTHPDFVRKLFLQEIPEVKEGLVEIKGIARFPGECTKIAVHSTESRIDGVGTCIGTRGNRIRNIIKELNQERIDVIRWSEDPAIFISSCLSPAKCERVELGKKGKEALVILDDDQVALAIGKNGQNIKLASKLCGWYLKVESLKEVKEEGLPAVIAVPGIGEKRAKILASSGFSSIKALAQASPERLQEIEGLGKKRAEKIIQEAKKMMGK